MAATQTGVDVVTRLRDETRPGVASIERSLKGMGQRIESSGGGIGKRFTDGLMGAMISGIAAAGLDRALEATLSGLKAGDTGRGIGLSISQGIVDGMRAIPVAGVLSELGARGLGAIFGDGFSTFEERQQAMDAQRAKALQAQEDEARITDRLRDDTLTPAQRRRRQFDDEAGKVLRNVDPAEVESTRERLRREFTRREGREFLREQDVQRRAIYDQRRRDEEQRAANERERIDSMQRERDTLVERQRDRAVNEAESRGRLGGAIDSRNSRGLAESFRMSVGGPSDPVVAKLADDARAQEKRDQDRLRVLEELLRATQAANVAGEAVDI